MCLGSRRELDAADGRLGELCRRSDSYCELDEAAGAAFAGAVLRSLKLNVLLGSNEARLEDDPLRGGSSRR